MPIYDVSVPIEPTLAESLDSTAVTRLPPGPVTVGRLTVVGDAQDDAVYVAAVAVEASTPSSGKRVAVGLVEDLLFLLAVDWDAFEIRFSRVRVRVVRSAVPDPPFQGEGKGAVLAAITAGATVGAGLGVAKNKTNLEREAQALQRAADWPPHVRRALELNYLAARHHDWSVKFLLLAICVEMLALKTEGSPATLLARRLSKPRRRYLRLRLCSVMRRFGLSDDDRDRLLERLSQTHEHSVVEQIGRYLSSRGVDIERARLGEWWRMRGRLAHGEVLSEERLRTEGDELRKAVRAALKSETTLD